MRLIVTWTVIVAIKMDSFRQICEIWGSWSRRNHAWLTSFKLEQLGKWWCHLFKLNIRYGEDLGQDNSSSTCLIWAIFICKWRFCVGGLIFLDEAQKKVWTWNLPALLEMVRQILLCSPEHFLSLAIQILIFIFLSLGKI